jgi:hypothetical protein
MSEASTARKASRVDASTPIEKRTFAEAGSSSEAYRAFRPATVRMQNYRRNKRLGLRTRSVRIGEKQVRKLIELGYLSLASKGDERAEGIAIEAYLADNL